MPLILMNKKSKKIYMYNHNDISKVSNISYRADGYDVEENDMLNIYEKEN